MIDITWMWMFQQNEWENNEILVRDLKLNLILFLFISAYIIMN